MGSYLKALYKIGRTSPKRKREIVDTVSKWYGPKGKQKGKGTKNGRGMGPHIVPNIEREFYLHVDRMVKILNTIHKYRLLIISELENRYLNECYNHVRQGHEIKTIYPTIVGRAVTTASFTQSLKDRYDLKRYEAESIVNKLVNRKRLSDHEKCYLMSEYSAWVTWNYKHPSRNPFYFAHSPHRAKKIRANLGLDPKKSHGDLLLLVYYTRPAKKLLIPTIADAGLYEYFQVAGERPTGSTKPWYESFIDNNINHIPQSRPEAVHEPEELSQIKYVRVAV